MDQPPKSDSTERIVAVALLTQHDLDVLGPAFKWAWPVEDAPEFAELLHAIDQADEQLRRSSERAESAP